MTIAVRGETPEECIWSKGNTEEFIQILTDPSITKYGYDLKRQINLLSYNGIGLSGKMMDIELMHYLVNPEKSHKIEILAKTYLDINLEELMPEKKESVRISRTFLPSCDI